ncbi:hypothetical protein [Phenylobacterium sp. 58.2.17]|uniref:hypothetical protein n=1 Tax=Phenylobacterium sp. 58.2.17 TaxID=2969306 RepID=UPI0022642997|nr:hypothetical protein [Phenylobacterium sp. 58.2.17]MCX7587173.1 hypothetical protein [Phenylobacterium sp. 58.2.17]
MLKVLAAVLVLAPGAALATDGAAACAGLVTFDREARLSADDIGRVSASGHRGVADRFLAFDSFRADGRPARAGRTALAVAGTGGEMGEQTYIGVLWTTQPEQFSADALAIVPTASGGAQIEVRATGACGRVWRMELSPGGAVSVNGRKAAELAR